MESIVSVVIGLTANAEYMCAGGQRVVATVPKKTMLELSGLVDELERLRGKVNI
jgi:hypothetical protein